MVKDTFVSWMATKENSVDDTPFCDILPDQRLKLSQLCNYISSKASLDHNNREIMDIHAAVCAMVSRIATQINDRGIFTISGIQPCGSQTERTSVWKVDTEAVQIYTEYDFLAVLKDIVVAKNDHPCSGCVQVQKPPINIEKVKLYHSRTTNYDEMLKGMLNSPEILSNLFWQELTWCLTCACTCLHVKFYDSYGISHENDVFSGIFTKVAFEPSNKPGADLGCQCCTVNMRTGTLRVNTTETVDQTSNKQTKCSLIFLWTSESEQVSVPNRTLTQRQQVKSIPIYVDFLPALRLQEGKSQSRNGNQYKNLLIVPKRCNICKEPGRWLISSCISEMNSIVKEMSDKHRKCLKVIKYLLPVLSNAHYGNIFSKVNPYHMKNVAICHSQNCTDSTNNVAKCVVYMFRQLENAYRAKLLRSAFLHINLLENAKDKYFTDSMAQIYRDYSDRVCCVSETDSWKSYIQRLVRARVYS